MPSSRCFQQAGSDQARNYLTLELASTEPRRLVGDGDKRNLGFPPIARSSANARLLHDAYVKFLGVPPLPLRNIRCIISGAPVIMRGQRARQCDGVCTRAAASGVNERLQRKVVSRVRIFARCSGFSGNSGGSTPSISNTILYSRLAALAAGSAYESERIVIN